MVAEMISGHLPGIPRKAWPGKALVRAIIAF